MRIQLTTNNRLDENNSFLLEFENLSSLRSRCLHICIYACFAVSLKQKHVKTSNNYTVWICILSFKGLLAFLLLDLLFPIHSSTVRIFTFFLTGFYMARVSLLNGYGKHFLKMDSETKSLPTFLSASYKNPWQASKLRSFVALACSVSRSDPITVLPFVTSEAGCNRSDFEHSFISFLSQNATKGSTALALTASVNFTPCCTLSAELSLLLFYNEELDQCI